MAKKIQCDLCDSIFDPTDSNGSEIAARINISIPKDRTKYDRREIRKTLEACQDCGRAISNFIDSRGKEESQRD
jgi:hypothetical protein